MPKKGNRKYLLMSLAVFISFSILFLLYRGVILEKYSSLRNNDRLITNLESDVIVDSNNPELIFDNVSESYIVSLVDMSYINMYEVPEDFYPWVGDGSYLTTPPMGINKNGIISVHPYSINKPSVIYQDISLGEQEHVLFASFANIANYTQPCEHHCNDNIVIIRIHDLETGNEEIIYEDDISSEEGWRSIYLDISDYANKDIRFILEGHAGGDCAEWCGEWAAVDEFYVGHMR